MGWTYVAAAFVLGLAAGSWVTDRIYAPLIPLCREMIDQIRTLSKDPHHDQ